MARSFQSTRRVPSVSARRKTTWGGIQSFVYSTVAADTLVLLASFSAAGLANIQKSTLIRVRGIVGVRSDQGAAFEDAQGAFGIAVVTDTAASLGVTALPDPVNDAAGDYWQTWQGLFSTPIQSTSARSPTQYMVDSKAQRKLGDLDAIVLLFKNAHATHGMQVAVQLRFLFLLS